MLNVYFDNASTTMPSDEARAAAAAAMAESWANPSSAHGPGRQAAVLLARSREAVGEALGADPGEIYFTSGGTEGDNWALRSGAFLGRHRGRHIITSRTEHAAVLDTARYLGTQGWEVTYLDPDKTGAVPLEALASALREDTVLVSLMLVNNETGAVNPVARASELIREKSPAAVFHVDAVQAFLKIPFTPKKLGADLVTVSSHKIHGPKGAGALYIRRGLRLPAMVTGGGQEGSLRPGTEAMPAIAGFAAAAREGKANMAENMARVTAVRDRVRELVSEYLPEAVFIGGGSPHILSLSLPGYRSEVLMSWLDGAGICVSRSSACKRGARSHVLEAMGLRSDVIDGAIRLSFSGYNTLREAEYFAKTLQEAAMRLRTTVKRGGKR